VGREAEQGGWIAKRPNRECQRLDVTDDRFDIPSDLMLICRQKRTWHQFT